MFKDLLEALIYKAGDVVVSLFGAMANMLTLHHILSPWNATIARVLAGLLVAASLQAQVAQVYEVKTLTGISDYISGSDLVAPQVSQDGYREVSYIAETKEHLGVRLGKNPTFVFLKVYSDDLTVVAVSIDPTTNGPVASQMVVLDRLRGIIMYYQARTNSLLGTTTSMFKGRFEALPRPVE